MQPKPMSTGGITVQEKNFDYNVYYEPPLYKGEVKDGDKVHTFIFPENFGGYREAALNELKRIGWVPQDAY
jgi:hypothetical protein